MDIPRWRQPQAARKLRSQVTDNVAKQIAGHNYIELAWIANNLHRQRVNEEMPRINIRIFLAYFLEHALPQPMRKRHGVRLVAHAHALQSVLPRVLERITDDALHPFA